jgi:prefoldin subunit 5
MTIDEVFQEVGNLHLQIKERDKLIADLQRTLAEKESKITELLTQLQEAMQKS